MGGTAGSTPSSRAAPNVTLGNLTIQHYNNGNGSQQGAIYVEDDDAAKAKASGWHLNNLNVGFNSASGSGTGNGWIFTGGRFHDNRQEGIGGAMGNGVTINHVQIDHNDFTNTNYTTRNWVCGDEAGGVKWVTNNMTVKNSSIHDNACKGLWADLGARHNTITNNHVYNNWDEGIFIEISSYATITGNTVTGTVSGTTTRNGSRCPWLFAGGITLNSSDHVVIAHNTVVRELQRDHRRAAGPPRRKSRITPELLVHDNTISGPGGKTGVSADNGADLQTRNIVFTNNTVRNGDVVLRPQLLSGLNF